MVQSSSGGSDAFTLQDRYSLEEGRILLTGLQALVRLPLDQHRADKRRGLRTATLISGYRGSPLGSYDTELQQSAALLAEHHMRFLPAVNEELAATAVFGSQTANLLPDPKYDGVLGIWYGKGPVVDRSGDAFKHANLVGTGRYGGVLALAGDDPTAKSSTIPSHSEIALYDAMMPVLYPADVQDILDLGRLGLEMSRYAGLWVGFKIVTNVADALATAVVSPDRIALVDPEFTRGGRPWRTQQNTALLSPHSLHMEKDVFENRLEAARAFARANGVNRVTVATEDAWLGIIAAGKTYLDLRESLLAIGLDDDSLRRHGIRLLKLGMISPIEPSILLDFAEGLERILVLEEKRSFIEVQCKDILYGRSNAPQVVGKKDEAGQTLVKPDHELDADEITRVLARCLQRRVDVPGIAARLSQVSAVLDMDVIPLLAREAYFCSGCPHNRSTTVPEGSIAGAGIGCHTLAILMDRQTSGVTQMGGEGANWVGASFFSDMPHMFQNIGDGTLAHSGSLAIRQAVAAGTNITYKILYNSAVAMTGGQSADGAIPVPELTWLLHAEGVRRIIVVTSDLDRIPKNAAWAPNTDIWDRDRLDEAQHLLRDVSGVSVLIYDQECAANLRRKRKRGLAVEPMTQVFINEAICEGCGDCGAKSNCLSVQPVETEFGRKTRIHNSSCNLDYTCLDGNCPAFITVTASQGSSQHPRAKVRVDQHIPEPTTKAQGSVAVLLAGIGGTGVVTVNQILGTAAFLDGKTITGLDQTGLSQKGGPVVSNLKINDEPFEQSNKIAVQSADVWLIFDLLTATSAVQLARASRERTVAVVSTSKVPTGAMVRSTAVEFPAQEALLSRINQRTREQENVFLDAVGLAETLFGNHLLGNMIMVGAAYQSGLLPVSATAIERAIDINGAAKEANRQAFRLGRLLIADPASVEALMVARRSSPDSVDAPAVGAFPFLDPSGSAEELARLLAIRVPELTAYQDEAYARRFVGDVERVYRAEQAVCPGKTSLSEAAATYLFKLMAYKDEYEVARLALKPEVKQSLAESFGHGAKIHYHLHPPILKALGLRRKIRFGAWFDIIYRVLNNMRRLRGTPLDPFGSDPIRKSERALIEQYRTLIFLAIEQLTPDNHANMVKLARLPDVIRGYDAVKLANLDRFWSEVRALGFPDVRASVREVRVNAPAVQDRN